MNSDFTQGSIFKKLVAFMIPVETADKPAVVPKRPTTSKSTAP